MRWLTCTFSQSEGSSLKLPSLSSVCSTTYRNGPAEVGKASEIAKVKYQCISETSVILTEREKRDSELAPKSRRAVGERPCVSEAKR